MTDFERVIRLLREYKAKYGNCLVPQAYITEEGIRLGSIVNSIRTSAIRTTEEERTILDSLGFVWKVRESPVPFKEVVTLLKEYKEKHGNCLVPQAYITEEGIRLGSIVNSIRTSARRTTEEEKTILDSVGFVWKVRESPLSFEKVVILLKEYKAKYGNCLVPYSYTTEDGVRLGIIVSSIRIGARKITEEEKTILDSVGFVWKVRESPLSFEKVVTLLKEYKEKYGNCLVPWAYTTEEGIRLGNMVHAIRTGYRKTTEEERVILDSLGFVWDARENFLTLEKVIKILKEYKAMNGNCLVPYAYITEEGIRLGVIVNNIRCGSRKITEEEKAILDSLGFVWKVKESPVSFEEVVRLLKEYKEKNGNLLVPQLHTTEEGIRLGVIVNGIRCGSRKTTEEEKEILDSLGFVWKINKSPLSFEEVVILLKEYKKEHGDCLVPQSYITDEGICLGKLVQNIRHGSRKTTEEERVILDNLGFVWKVTRGGRKK